MKTSTATVDAIFAPRANFAASRPPLTAPESAERLRATVTEFSAPELAKAAHATKSTAKGWKSETENRGASYWAIANMARSLPRVQEMVLEDIGFASVEGIINAFYRVAMGNDEQAWIARAMIAKLRKPDAAEPQDSAIVYIMSQHRRAA